jgi:hypothetical protein
MRATRDNVPEAREEAARLFDAAAEGWRSSPVSSAVATTHSRSSISTGLAPSWEQAF